MDFDFVHEVNFWAWIEKYLFSNNFTCISSALLIWNLIARSVAAWSKNFAKSPFSDALHTICEDYVLFYEGPHFQSLLFHLLNFNLYQIFNSLKI